jgi:hypothetical protein
VHFHQKEYVKALESFNKTIEIFPSWEKEWAGPYIEKINREIKTLAETPEVMKGSVRYGKCATDDKL